MKTVRFENSRLPSQLSNDLRKKTEKNLKRKKTSKQKNPLRRQLNIETCEGKPSFAFVSLEFPHLRERKKEYLLSPKII